MNQPIRFSTKQCDYSVGLAYYGFRFYSLGLGRWLSRDPLGERQGPNLYAFARNNPLRYFDYWGLFIGDYGNYCGAARECFDSTGRAGGQIGPKPCAPPCDDGGVDAACLEHDQCLHDTGLPFWLRLWPSVRACHLQLCWRAITSSPTTPQARSERWKLVVAFCVILQAPPLINPFIF